MPRFPLLIPLLVLYLLICTAAGATERPLAPQSFGPAFGEQRPIAIEFHGHDGFVLWNDSRPGTAPAVFGSRVDASGALLDPYGIRVGGGSGHAVVWAGDAWIVIWTEMNRVYGRRISRTGELWGPSTVLMTRPGENVHAASNGRTLFVTNQRITEHYAVVANADLSGVREVDTNLIRPFEVFTDGTEYVVFGYLPWLLGGGVQAARYSSSGATLLQKDTGIEQPFRAATRTGRDFVIAAGKQNDQLWRLSHDLLSLSGPIRLPADSPLVTLVVGDDSGGAVAIWAESDPVTFARTSYAAAVGQHSSGNAVALQRTSRSGGYWSVRAAPTPDGYVFAGDELRTIATSRDLADVETNALASRAELTRSAAAQFRFAPVRDGSSDLYVFMEQDGVTSRVMIGRHGGTARPLVATGFAQYSPSIASNGRNAIVTWIEDRAVGPQQVMSLIVDLNGEVVTQPAVLGPTSHATSAFWSFSDQGVWPAAVVWTGMMYLVSWDGLLARVLENGFLLDSEPRVLYPGRQVDHPSMARLGNVVIYVWMEGGTFRRDWCYLPYVCGEPTIVRAARLTADGQVIDLPPIEITPPGFGLPQIAVNGDVALIVTDNGSLVRFAADGSVGPILHLAQLMKVEMYRASVARHLDGFVVAWQSSGGHNIAAVLLSRDLEVGPPVILSRNSPSQGPQAWTTPMGHAAVAYLKAGPDTTWVPRLYTFTFGEPLPVRTRAVRR